MKKINLRGVSKALSEREMKDVMGGGSENYLMAPGGKLDDFDSYGAKAKPCPPPHKGCGGPHGTWVSGGLCCLLPCNGIFSTYGYAILTGFSKCPW